MRIIASGRKTSRTTRLIEMCAELEAKGEISYIVCKNQEQAYAIAKKAKELNLVIGFPISYDEFMRYEYSSRSVRHFLIDNADHFLESLTPVNIAAIVVESDGNTT